MSEYQYYEFRTVNRTLTSGEVKEVNSKYAKWVEENECTTNWV